MSVKNVSDAIRKSKFNLHRENSVSDRSQCIVNNRKFKMRRRRQSQKSNSWLAAMPRDKAAIAWWCVGGQYNRIFSRIIYMKIGFSSQRREMFLVLTLRHHQYGRRDVTCKPAIAWQGKTTPLHVPHAFFVRFFAVTAWLPLENV